MKIKVGKKYRTREGKIVTVKSYNPCPGLYYPFKVDVNGVDWFYNESGFHVNSRVASSIDIVEEIKESGIKLEAGKKYRTVDGTVLNVEGHYAHGSYKFVVVDRLEKKLAYTSDGFYFASKEYHRLNIVEEIKGTAVRLEFGKKYRTVGGDVATVKDHCQDSPLYFPFVVEVGGFEFYYDADGFHCSSHVDSSLNIIEEIQENKMFNKDYKYLCMDADGYNKAAFNRPTISFDLGLWEGCDAVIIRDFFNLGTDWKESLREIVYNDDGSIYLRKPRHEFKVDDKVLVRGTGDSDWRKRHFSHWDCNGKPRCFADGTTSFSGVHVNMWDEIKPYVEEGE